MTVVDLTELVGRLASRGGTRTEADIQADVRNLLLYGGLNLSDPQVLLESPSPGRRRIDIEVGAAAIEIKRDLSVGNVREEGRQQLEGYVVAKTQLLDRR